MECSPCQAMERGVCLFTSGLMAGVGTVITTVVVPALKETSDPLPAWKRVYKNGSKLALTSIFVTSGLAVKLFLKTKDSRYLYLAGTTFIIAPYTVLFMMNTNKALFAIKDAECKESREEMNKVRQLIDKWDKYQMTRTVLGLVGFGINIWIVCRKCKGN